MHQALAGESEAAIEEFELDEEAQAVTSKDGKQRFVVFDKV